MTRQLSLLTLLVLGTLLLTGCWDYLDIESLDFVFGAGVDQVEPEFVVVTEMIKSSGGGSEVKFEPVVMTTKGRSLSAAGRALSNPAGRVVFWPHAYVYLISEEVARQGVLPAIDYVLRSRLMRSTVHVFVTKGCTVEEVFKGKPPFHDSVSQHLNSIIQMQALLSHFYPQRMWQFNTLLVSEGIQATLPTVQLVHERGELVPIVGGAAVFKGDKMVGWLDNEENQIFNLLKGLFQRGDFVMDIRIEGELYPITFEIIGNQVQLKPVVEGERAAVEIRVDLQLNATEIGAAQINFQEEKLVKDIESQVAHAFNRRIMELIDRIQTELNSDILGFGQLFRRRKPDLWRKHGKEWDTFFPTISASTVVNAEIKLTGLASDSITVRN